ncbi:MAG TPA: alpha/beta hydrolase-fold protein [Chloroflexota bacterium]|jgi:enterochelin esterase family protein|nr:alpha/beta hydrolase-fold protein [Chloroflexota bacterium]
MIHSNPVITGTTARFVWRGADPPEIIGDFNGWMSTGALRFNPAGAHESHASLDLLPDAYMEYAFVRGEQRIPDPLNDRSRPNGIGQVNDYFSMPRWRSTDLVRARRGVAHGTINSFTIRNQALIVGGRRKIWLYAPPVEKSVRLLVVLDGQDYLRKARLAVIVDNLIALNRIRPIAMAFVEHGRQSRVIEYASNDATAAFIVKEVIPLAARHLNLETDGQRPCRCGVLGASMGGLMALHLGLLYPDFFASVYSQSGAFRLESILGRSLLEGLIPSVPVSDVIIRMEWGQYEGLRDANKTTCEALDKRGYSVTHREYSGGHNWISWRNELAHGLEALFPPVRKSIV